MTELTPTRTTFLEIQDELRRLAEGYHFLDEKSVLLAHEILRQLALYETNLADLKVAHEQALQALTAAATRHGLDALETQPPADLAGLTPELRRESFLGLPLFFHEWPSDQPTARFAVVDPSPEVDGCRAAFIRCLALHSAQAVIAGNLLRLRDEYVRTERRARALDQLIMPEMRQTLKQIDDQLESVDQEEAMRVRNAAKLADHGGRA